MSVRLLLHNSFVVAHSMLIHTSMFMFTIFYFLIANKLYDHHLKNLQIINYQSPVKIFLHVFPNIQPWQVALTSVVLMTYVFISEMKQMLYFGVKIFFHSILSIFFREVSIVGKQNIPHYGPVIFTGNHANQFIDSVVMLCTCQRTISYLIAEKSYNRRIIGDIAWAMGAVPVKRAQDAARTGSGKIVLEKEVSGTDDEMICIVVNGHGTKFLSQVKVKDKIRFAGASIGLKVVSIESDTLLKVDGSTLEQVEWPSDPISYDILHWIDQKVVYEKVLSKLASGGTIGIFPEGGSHDRTDLLPLKVGVALIAYSALEKDGLSIPIVPVGLNYFRGHRFRGRVTVEYGKPIYADPTKLSDFVKGGEAKRQVCNEVLERITDSMRSVIISAPDYQTLKLIHTARRLYRSKYMSSWEKQDLSRRFAEGYKRLLTIVNGNPPKE
jgi:1-acyl-sn-glycerol-3-phosphate acyltransferase